MMPLRERRSIWLQRRVANIELGNLTFLLSLGVQIDKRKKNTTNIEEL